MEQGHDAEFSSSYKFDCEALTSKLDIQAGKKIYKARLVMTTGMKNAESFTGDGSSPE